MYDRSIGSIEMKITEFVIIGGISLLFSFSIMTVAYELPFFNYWFLFVPIIGIWIGMKINNYYQTKTQPENGEW